VDFDLFFNFKHTRIKLFNTQLHKRVTQKVQLRLAVIQMVISHGLQHWNLWKNDHVKEVLWFCWSTGCV